MVDDTAEAHDSAVIGVVVGFADVAGLAIVLGVWWPWMGLAVLVEANGDVMMAAAVAETRSLIMMVGVVQAELEPC